MAYIPEAVIEEIRQEADIVDIISQYTSLNKTGKNYMAHCPFHEDRTPSLSVSEDKQLFHCFSCGRAGTIFTFLQEMEGYSFSEAVLKVAEAINHPAAQTIDFQQSEPPSPQAERKTKLLKLHKDSAAFFHHLLMHSEQGKTAYDYLSARGLTDETMEQFKLGYSPKQRKALYLYLKENNDMKDFDACCRESGLFSDYHLEENDEYLDRFSDRIIFPIKDLKGQTIAFSGRSFNVKETDHQVAKYLNSPETLLFNKRTVLFNIHAARAEIRRQKEIILFEGYMDVIAAWQAGVKNGIATMGTALTTGHLKTIDRYTEHLLLAFDGDKAGQQATKKAIDELTEQTHFEIETVSFPPGYDPDEYIKNYSAEQFKNLIEHGRDSVLSFYMRYYRTDKNLANATEQVEYINDVLQEVARLASPIEKDLILKKLADEFELSTAALNEQFQAAQAAIQKVQISHLKTEKQKIEQSAEPLPTIEKLSVVERAEQMLLHRLFNSDEAWQVLQQLNPDFSFAHENYQLLYILFDAFRKKHQTAEVISFLDFLSDQKLKTLAATIMWMDLGTQFTSEEISDYMRLIENISPLQEQLNHKKADLEQAKQLGNSEAILALSAEIILLNQQLKNNK